MRKKEEERREEKHLIYSLLKESVRDSFLVACLIRLEELDDLIQLNK